MEMSPISISRIVWSTSIVWYLLKTLFNYQFSSTCLALSCVYKKQNITLKIQLYIKLVAIDKF